MSINLGSKLSDLLTGGRPSDVRLPNGDLVGLDPGLDAPAPSAPSPEVPVPGPAAPGLQHHGADSLPPGLARQLNDPPPTAALPASQRDPGQILSDRDNRSISQQNASQNPYPLEDDSRRNPVWSAGPGRSENVQAPAVTAAANRTPDAAPPPAAERAAIQSAAGATTTAGSTAPAAPTSAVPTARAATEAPAYAQTPQGTTAATGAAAADRAAAAVSPNPLAAAATAATIAAAKAAADAAPVMGTTATLAPAPGTTADTRGIVLPGHDRVVAPRADAHGVPTYTGDGLGRRTMSRDGNGLPALLSRWWSLRENGLHGHYVPDPERNASRALQWLFWILMIAAYASLAVALIVLLPGGRLIGAGGQPSGGGIALFVGIVVAIGAWWLARRMARK